MDAADRRSRHAGRCTARGWKKNKAPLPQICPVISSVLSLNLISCGAIIIVAPLLILRHHTVEKLNWVWLTGFDGVSMYEMLCWSVLVLPVVSIIVTQLVTLNDRAKQGCGPKFSERAKGLGRLRAARQPSWHRPYRMNRLLSDELLLT